MRFSKTYEFNKADYKLYQHFSKIFDQKVEKYGRDKMKDQVFILKNLTKNYEKVCMFPQFAEKEVKPEYYSQLGKGKYQIEKSIYEGWVPSGVIAKDLKPNPNLFFSEDLDDLKTYQDCMLKMIPELRFAEMLRYLQDFNVFNYGVFSRNFNLV